MDEVYLIIRGGVYRHEILGIYTDKNEAIRVGEAARDTERDSYHNIKIYKGRLNDCYPDVEVVENLGNRKFA